MRVLIVDDERQTRESIRRHVGWEKWGIADVDLARDGQDALERVRGQRYDIAICDIRMPRLDGIRFAQHLFESQPDCRVIFLSGYADKEYLFSAIRLHAVAYVEKPFEVAELERAIDEAVAQIASQKRPRDSGGDRVMQERRAALALDMLQAREAPARDLCARLREAGLPAECQGVTTAILSLEIPAGAADRVAIQREQSLATLANRFNAPSHNYMLCAREGTGIVAHLLAGQQEVPPVVSLLIDAAGQLAGGDCRVLAGIGETAPGPEGAPQSYAQARKALERTFFTEATTVYFARMEALAVYKPNPYRLEGLASAVHMGNGAKAAGIVADLFAELKGGDISPRAACDVVLSALGRLPEYDPVRDAATTQACQHIDMLEQLVRARIDDALVKSTLYGGDNRTVREVMEVIHAEYSNPRLSIAGIAHRVYLTPNYLSHVFKKETGKTINAYIAQYRVAVAERMLGDPSLHLYEIAIRSGFGSVENFSRIFKKVKGVLPSVQRKKL